jgi:hypothetical protein
VSERSELAKVAATNPLPDQLTMMEGPAALPMDNGELVFAAPWEGRAVALAIATVERLGVDWDEFRERLIGAIADDPERPYYESWATALEALLLAHGLTTAAAIDASTPAVRPAPNAS